MKNWQSYGTSKGAPSSQLQIEQYTNRYKWCSSPWVPFAQPKQKFVKGESESYQANEIKVHVITMRNEWFASATIASVKKNCSRNPFSYAFHQLVFIWRELATFFFRVYAAFLHPRQLVAPCHVVVVWTMINIFYPFFLPSYSASQGEELHGNGMGLNKKSLRDFFSLEGRRNLFSAFTGRWSLP